VINLGAAMVGGNGNREKDDFYPTPPEATVALMLAVRLAPCIWEPACGDGAMCRVLEAVGHKVVATDLIDRGYGRGGVDFLQQSEPFDGDIATNPPFKTAAAFIEHSATLAARRFFLLKVSFWNAARRMKLFTEHPPSLVMPLTWRLDFTGGGAPTMDCMWCAWGTPERGFKPLPRPGAAVMEMLT
jgi:hypothetical protein